MIIADINHLTAIEFGSGAIATLPAELRALGVERPLVVSDHGIQEAGLLMAVQKRLPLQGKCFLDVSPNPTEGAVGAGLEAYQAGQCDGVVTMGGGSGPNPLPEARSTQDRVSATFGSAFRFCLARARHRTGA